MSQAEQLHADIERSRLTAREIVAEHDKTGPLESKVADATAKVDLLQVEIAYNDAVTSALEEVQRVRRRLESGRAALSHGDVGTAVETAEDMVSVSEGSLFANTNLMGILAEDVSGLRREVVKTLESRWNEQVTIDKQKGELRIKDIEGKREVMTWNAWICC